MTKDAVDQFPIIQTGIKNLAIIDRCINTILKFRPEISSKPGPPYAIINNSEIPTAAESLCAAQLVAFSCLFDDGSRSTEGPRFRKLRLERVQVVKDQCKGVRIEALRNRGVRNALAHFDERYLKAIVNYPNGGWMTDIALSHKEAFDLGPDPEQRYIRVYIYNTDEFFVLGEKISLLKMREEIDAIMNAFGLKFDTTDRVF